MLQGTESQRLFCCLFYQSGVEGHDQVCFSVISQGVFVCCQSQRGARGNCFEFWRFQHPFFFSLCTCVCQVMVEVLGEYKEPAVSYVLKHSRIWIDNEPNKCAAVYQDPEMCHNRCF